MINFIRKFKKRDFFIFIFAFLVGMGINEFKNFYIYSEKTTLDKYEQYLKNDIYLGYRFTPEIEVECENCSSKVLLTAPLLTEKKEHKSPNNITDALTLNTPNSKCILSLTEEDLQYVSDEIKELCEVDLTSSEDLEERSKDASEYFSDFYSQFSTSTN